MHHDHPDLDQRTILQVVFQPDQLVLIPLLLPQPMHAFAPGQEMAIDGPWLVEKLLVVPLLGPLVLLPLPMMHSGMEPSEGMLLALQLGPPHAGWVYWFRSRIPSLRHS